MYKAEDYLINRALKRGDLVFHPDTDGVEHQLDPDLLLQAVIKANADADTQIKQFDSWRALGMVPLWDCIMEKNRSGAMGETLGVLYCGLTGHATMKNPREAGSPDFFPVCEESKKYLEQSKDEVYTEGGFDTKGCKISDRRFMSMKPSSHHRQTSSILLSGWDYEGRTPQILAVCYTNGLTPTDWKPTNAPKNEQSRLTNSSYLLPSGMEKLRLNWVILHRSIRPPRSPEDVAKSRLELFLEFQGKGPAAISASP